MKTLRTAAMAAALTCLGAAPAQAHVTVHPNVVPAGGFTVVNVRVPNERDNASTTKIDVQFPPGFLFVSYEPLRGWSAKVTYRKLAQPVEAFGEKITQEADRVTFTATGMGVRPGTFVQFPLSVGIPEKARSPLTFKALQTYSNGEVVRWIGDPSAETPAPQVAVAGAKDAIADVPAGGVPPTTKDDAATPATPTSSSVGDDGPSTGLVIAALILGSLGLAAGGAALLTGRRTRAVV